MVALARAGESMGESQSLRDLPSGTVANIAIILMVSVLAIIQLKAVIQPLVIAILLFIVFVTGVLTIVG